MSAISYDDFDRVEIRVGRIVRVEDFPKAKKPAYKLWVDFGDFGVKRSSAQCTLLYGPEELMDRQVLAVTNFAPKQVADFMSEVLVLGLEGDGAGEIVLIQPERQVALGRRLF